MRLTIELRGVDLLSVEFHAGSKGLLLDVSVFQPHETHPDRPAQTTADLTGTTAGVFERQHGPVWDDDQPALVRGFGFQGGPHAPE